MNRPDSPNDSDDARSQRTNNLARIRDNQRRSRARRKEYLQDLEAKYRNCEQLGVEASAEIQAAARRVVDENKRLRALLKQRGVTDADIDGAPIEPSDNPQLTASAKSLEDMLSVRRVCKPGTSCGPGSTSCTPQQSLNSPTSPTSPMMSATTRNASSMDSSGRRPQSLLAAKPPALAIAPAPNMQQYHQQQQQQQYSPMTTTSLQHLQQAQSLSHQPQQTDHFPYDFDPSSFPLDDMHHSQWDSSFDPHSSTSTNYANLQPQHHQQHHHRASSTSTTTTTIPKTEPDSAMAAMNLHSCRTAAEAIRTLNPDLGLEVEAELGCCGTGECVVPTQQVFDILSRMQGLD